MKRFFYLSILLVLALSASLPAFVLGGGPQLNVTPGEPGGYMDIEVTGLTSGSHFVVLVSSLGSGPTATPYGMVDVSAPFRRTPLFPEIGGSFSWTNTVPEGATGVTFYMQAVEMLVDGGTITSNPATIPID